MTDANLFLADAGLAAGGVAGSKGRAEPGAGKGQSGVANEQGEDFEQLIAKGHKTRDGEAEASSEKDNASTRSRVRGPSLRWPDGEHVTGKRDKPAEEFDGETEKAETSASEADVDAGDLGQAERSAKAGQNAIAEVLPDVGSKTSAAVVADAAKPAGAAKAGQDKGSESAGKKAMPVGRGADELSGDSQTRQAAGSENGGQTGKPTDVANQSSTGSETRRATPTTAAPILPGMVEPAAAQLAAVLAQGRETGKRDASSARGALDVPAKIHVSLAETHFSPVKPDSEMEAYDLALRTDGERPGKDLARSPRDTQRMQAELKTEKAGRAASSTQSDVRAEQLAQNVAKPASGDISGQIGTKILQELEQSRPSNETRSSGPVHVKQSDPVLKVLEIKLEPRELGSVVVRMSLRNDVLNVELGFGKSDAAAAIAKNTDQLTHYLRSSGYIVDEIVVRVVDGDRVNTPVATTATTGADSTHVQGAAGNSASSSGLTGQSFGEQGERQPATRGDNSGPQHNGEGSHGQDDPQSRSHGDLFV